MPSPETIDGELDCKVERSGATVLAMVTGPAVHNITALTLYVDTNIVDARDDAALSLRRLRDEGEQ